MLKEDGPYGFREQGPYLMKQYFKFYLAVPSMNCLLSPELIEAEAQCGTKSFKLWPAFSMDLK